MTEKEIITKFVNSDSFPIIHNYISGPYEETINEMQQDKDNLIKYLEDSIRELEADFDNNYDLSEYRYYCSVKQKVYQEVLERLKSEKYE